MSNLPKAGQYYYHCSHNNSRGPLDHAYMIIGLGLNTETNAIEVIYRPLYSGSMVEEKSVEFFVRPLDMFIEQNIVSKGVTYPERFKLVEGSQLEELRAYLTFKITEM